MNTPASPAPLVPPRIASIDAYRGFVMLLMMAEVLRLQAVAKVMPGDVLWELLAWHQTHVPWAGCTLHDLIQPSFSFLVGCSLPFSLASRTARGAGRRWILLHALWRAILLALLGVFLRSMGKPQTNWTFDDTLTQIGFGYVPLVLIGFLPVRGQWLAFTTIVVGWWAAFAFYPLPAGDFDYAKVGVPTDWPLHYAGLAAHWNKNSNLAWAFDTWWMNLFPRPEVWKFHGGGYATLNFVPTLATMILGLLAGGWLRERSKGDTTQTAAEFMTQLLTTGGMLLALGWLCDAVGLCPNVKRIWTPAWVLFSGGWCFLFLAGFYFLCDLRGWTSWSFPLRVIGANSILAYCLAHGGDDFIIRSLQTHFGADVFRRGLSGPEEGIAAFAQLRAGFAALAVEWLILFWLYRQKIHVRI